jgi:hypothetical protein
VAPPRRDPEPHLGLQDAHEDNLAGGEEPDLENPEFLYESTREEPEEAAPEQPDTPMPEEPAEPAPEEPVDPLFGLGSDDELDLGVEQDETDSQGMSASEEWSGLVEPPEDPPDSSSPLEEADGPSVAESEDPGGLLSAPFADLALEEPWDPSQPDPIPTVLDEVRTVAKEARQPQAPLQAPAAEKVARPEPAAGGKLARILALVVGLALIAGGLRALALYAIGSMPGPGVIEGSGWVASEIRARHLHVQSGRGVLVVSGRLESSGATEVPSVQVTLLDVNERPLAPAVEGVLTLREGARQLAPTGSGVGNGAGSTRPALAPRADQVSGFSIVIADPPSAARRYRLELLPG